MSHKCPHCDLRTSCTKNGYFVRKSDQRRIQRFKCLRCSEVFSKAVFQECYWQKKRNVNNKILELLCSGVSQRRISRLLKLNRKTVYRKFVFLAKRAKLKNFKEFKKLYPLSHVQFDDLETIEHTKCKPLSVTLAVAKESRRILSFAVSQMPAKGHLSKIARKKYGHREDYRPQGREDMFLKLSLRLAPDALIESDDNPHYKPDVKRFFPKAIHKTFLGQRGSVAGQGELKKIVFDPLFSLNHTFAMMRANINRLFRKTWCTTKLPERLQDHIELYTYYHNEILLKKTA